MNLSKSQCNILGVTNQIIANISRNIKYSNKLSFVEKRVLKYVICFSNILLARKIFNEPNCTLKYHKNWYWLSQIQHSGIPTRLLDWTADIRVALFFAVRNKKFHNVDGDLWVLYAKDSFNLSSLNQEAVNPLEINEDFFVNIPIHWNKHFKDNENQRKILGQQGKFFIRPYSKTKIPLEDDSKYQPLLRRFKIPSSSKKNILKSLNDQNYSDATIFKTTSIKMRLIKILLT